MYGPHWPNGGEVDIIEGANMAYNNLMSAHTSAGCSLLPPSQPALFTGTEDYTDCSNTAYGCNFVAPTSDMSSYGTDFNAVGGGVYALQWTDDAIQIWHFSRNAIPVDIVTKTPDPTGWGPPQARFGGSGCDVDRHFDDMSIVLNIDFCGTYAGNLWASDTQCFTYAATCEEWVGNNPAMLTELYWEVNYIDVYDTTVAPTAASIIPDVFPTYTATQNGTLMHRPSGPGALNSISGLTNTAAATPKTGTVTTKTGSAPTSAISPVDSVVPEHNPATIDVFSYLGCFSSTSGFSSFDLSGTDSALTLEKCVGLCSGRKYAGAVDTTCYCANTLDAGTGAVQDRASCNNLCPGNNAEYCGGSTSSSKRAALSNVLLSMYGNINGLNATTPAPPPALGSNTTSSITSVANASASATALQVITSTITYTEVCETDPAQLVTLTYCTTITVCPTSSPSIPQTVITQSCAGCGKNGSSVVTLTTPVQVAVTKTAYGMATATGYVLKPTTTFFPVTAAAAPKGQVPEFLLTLLGLVGLLLG